jgi:hypothetical protein
MGGAGAPRSSLGLRVEKPMITSRWRFWHAARPMTDLPVRQVVPNARDRQSAGKDAGAQSRLACFFAGVPATEGGDPTD